jgi:hypothetical protein
MTRLRATVAAAGLLAGAAVVSAGIFGPGPNAVTIPSTGQPLSIAITAPADNATIPIPPGTAQLQGSCAIGSVAGQTINVVYVVDVSGSTDLNFLLQNNRPLVDANGNGVAGDPGDDFNGDGEAGDILDGEVAGVLALHASIGNPPNVNVGLVAFATNASAADVNPNPPNTGGISQVFTTPPQVDLDGLNGPDIPEVVRSLDSDFTSPAGGQIRKFTLVPRSNLGSATNFSAALQKTNDTLALFPAGQNIVFFLSDGESNQGGRCFQGACASQLATALGAGTKVHTVGVGAAADPVDLQYIANQTGGTFTHVLDPSDLSTSLPLVTPAGLDRVEVDGQPVPLDALGNFTKTITCVDESPFTVTATCFADDPDDTSVSADVTLTCVVLCGNGVVDAGAGEECDPPNGTTCDAACQRIPICGDGFVDDPEVCDPPDGTTCAGDCTPIACGDGVVEGLEECDPPDGTTCAANCQRIPICGDGFVDAPETCDPPNGVTCNAACQAIVCGDGVVDGQEECDPPQNGVCDASCQRIPICGDGFVDTPETCDPPDGVTCNANCRSIVCGDGKTEGLEECDPPNGVTCDEDCVLIVCPDDDEDGICDPVDNCPNEPNPDQTDTDGDGVGDACDPCTDTDGDGFGDPGFPQNVCPPDVCPEEYDPDQHDLDGDGIGDVCDDEDDRLNVFAMVLTGARTKPTGKVNARGDFVVVPPEAGPLAIEDFFNAELGISVRVRDNLFLDETFSWPASECVTRFRRGLLRRITCVDTANNTKGIFKPINKNPGAVKFIVKARRLDIRLPFQKPVEVTITSIGVINRVGAITDCETKAGGMKCRE